MNGIALPNTIPQGLPLGATPAAGAATSLGLPSAASGGQAGFQPTQPSGNTPPAGPFQSSFQALSQISQLGSPLVTAQSAQSTNQPDANLNVAQNVGLGLAKGAVETASKVGGFLDNTLGRVVNAVTGRGFTPINRAAEYGITIDTQAHNTAQSIGKGAEQILELLAAPEAGVGDAAIRLGADAATFGGKAAILGAKAAGSGIENLALGQAHNSQTPGTDFAFGAAAPVIGAGISKLWENATQIIGKTFNLPKAVQTLFETPEGKTMFQQGVKEVAENPQAPYQNLAQEVYSGMVQGEQGVKQAYKTGIESVKAATAGKVFDVSPQIDDLNKVLSDNNIKVALVRGTDGALTSELGIVKTPQLQLSDPEVSKINDLLNSARLSKTVSFDDLRQLQQKFDNAYDAVPFGVNNTPTIYHNIVGKLGNVIDSKVAQVTEDVQPVMKDINAQYREYKQVFEQFGNKFIDRTTGAPQLAPGAESFLANLLNKNKAVLQGNVAKKLEEFSGVPILDRTTGVKAAYDMAALNASGKLTKVQKILQSVGAGLGTGIGFMKGGLGGAFEGSFAGRKGGEILGSIGKPSMGMKALGAVEKIGAGLKRLPAGTGKVIGAAAKVGQRGLTNPGP